MLVGADQFVVVEGGTQVQVARPHEQHLRPGRCGVVADVDPRDPGQVQPARGIPEHLSDAVVPDE